MSRAGGATLEDYLVLVEDYKDRGGFKIPTRAEAIWRLDTGDFSYYKFKVTDIEYNKLTIY